MIRNVLAAAAFLVIGGLFGGAIYLGGEGEKRVVALTETRAKADDAWLEARIGECHQKGGIARLGLGVYLGCDLPLPSTKVTGAKQ